MRKMFETILANTVHIFGDVTRTLSGPIGVEMQLVINHRQ